MRILNAPKIINKGVRTRLYSTDDMSFGAKSTFQLKLVDEMIQVCSFP